MRVLATIVCGLLCAPAIAATTWSDIRPGTGTKPLILVIGHPTGVRWKVPVDGVIVDRDVFPRVASAYEVFASISGVAGEPFYVLVSPFLEPIAAATDPAAFAAIVDLEGAKSDAALAVRRHLLSGKAHSPAREYGDADVIGGGVFRTRSEFDKLLSDQATFALTTADRKAARAALEYVLSELRDESGVFFAGARADSIVPGDRGPLVVEGGHYRWTPFELKRLLGDRAADIVAFHYGLPYFRQPRDPGETRARFSLTAAELEETLQKARQTLLAARSKRPDPPWHRVVVSEDNARMISALARGSIEFDEPRYRDAARQGIRALLTRHLQRSRFLRSAGADALPEDYAATVTALLDVYRTTFEIDLIERAIELQRMADAAAPPSIPAPVAALAAPVVVPPAYLAPLAAITGDPAWTARAGNASRQVLIAGNPEELLKVARGEMVFLLNSKRTRERLAVWMPYVKDIAPLEKQAVATVCVERTCRTPTTDPAVLAAWLR